MSTQREIRYIEATEVRAMGGSGDADPLRIEGYASVFNRSAKLPGFRERILPGAFSRAIDQKQDVVCLFNHNSDIVLGRTTSGTLRLKQDARGLFYTCDLPNTSSARDIHESIRRGDINGCSFAFNIPDGGQDWSEQRDEDGTYFVQRDISDTNLLDVSPVTYPCYSGTDVYARAAAEVPAELRSAVDAKNAALIVPPAIEKRPYDSVDQVPDSVPAGKKKQWMEVWNSVYKKQVGDGASQKDAESSAFAQANGVVKERAMKTAAEMRQIVDAIDNNIDSFEDAICEVSAALAKAYPAPDTAEGMYAPCYGGRFYEVETYEDFVIVVECATGENFMVPYLHDESKPEGEEITFGEPVAVEKTWVPSDRNAKKIAEYRTAFPLPVVKPAEEVVVPPVETRSDDSDEDDDYELDLLDESKVRDAMGKYGRGEYPAEKKDGIYKRIEEAAKKFGIEMAGCSMSGAERSAFADRLHAAMVL